MPFSREDSMKSSVTFLVFILLFLNSLSMADYSLDSLANPVANPVSETPAAVIDSTSGQAATSIVYPITPERRELLNRYSNFSQWWDIFDTLFGWILLLAITLTGISSRLFKLTERIFKIQFLQFLLYLALLIVILFVVSFPLDYYRDFVVEHGYGLSSQSFGGWLSDWAKNIPIEYVGFIIMFGFLFFLIRRSPRRWWLWFSLGAIPVVILLIVVAPIIISPLFNDFVPLQDQQLKTEITALADRGGIGNADIFQVNASKQSNKLNAYVTGLFGSKRIVLYDTLIKALTTKQILFVMAHEMGHYVMHHVWLTVLMIIALLALSTWLIARFLPSLIKKYQRRFGFDSITSYAATPLILFALGFVMFFAQPATNSLSRYFEHQADKYAMEMTDYNSADAIVAFEKLSAYNLSDPDPNPFIEFWFYNHPALHRRIDFVKDYKGN